MSGLISVSRWARQADHSGRAAGRVRRRVVYPAIAAGMLFAMGLLLAVTTAGDYGVAWDDRVQTRYGHLVLDYFLTAGQDRSCNAFLDLCFYGPPVELGAAVLARLQPERGMERRHLLTALIALLSIPALYRWGRVLGNRWVGLLAALLLLACPRFYGHAFVNAKDIPFAVGMIASLAALASLFALRRYRWREYLHCGLLIGCTVAVRPGGWLILGSMYVLAAIHADWTSRRGHRQSAATVNRGQRRPLGSASDHAAHSLVGDDHLLALGPSIADLASAPGYPHVKPISHHGSGPVRWSHVDERCIAAQLPGPLPGGNDAVNHLGLRDRRRAGRCRPFRSGSTPPAFSRFGDAAGLDLPSPGHVLRSPPEYLRRASPFSVLAARLGIAGRPWNGDDVPTSRHPTGAAVLSGGNARRRCSDIALAGHHASLPDGLLQHVGGRASRCIGPLRYGILDDQLPGSNRMDSPATMRRVGQTAARPGGGQRAFSLVRRVLRGTGTRDHHDAQREPTR